MIDNLRKKYVRAEKELNFGELSRKLTTLDTILDDLKKAAQKKEEDDAIHELYNMKRTFDSLIKELNL